MNPLSLAVGLSNTALGVDIGGSGIKGAMIDLADGRIVGDRVKVDTPEPSTPDAVATALKWVIEQFDYGGPVGVGFPAVIKSGEVFTANNIDKSWIGTNALDVFSDSTGRDLAIVNDADAAALCERRYGTAQEIQGLAIVLTFGSGIGSGFLFNGELVPNTELGVIELEGHSPAEAFFSAKARKREGLSWDEWGARVDRYLGHVTKVFTPELIAVGGGVSRRWDKWSHQIDETLPVVRASRANNAGIVGAATLVG